MVKLVCYNIEYCEGMEGLWYQYLKFWKLMFPPKNLDCRIIDALRCIKPDILALVEVDNGSFRAKKDEVLYFQEQLGLRDFAAKVKYPLEGWLRLFHHVPILQKQANAIISKYKIHSVNYHILHEGTKRVVIDAEIRCPRKVSLILVHLALGMKTRERQIDELIKIVNSKDHPVVLMGDFNTRRGPHEISRLLHKTHLRDRAKLDKHSLRLTHPSWHPMRRLDYVLVSGGIKVNKYHVLNYQFSDHMPLFVDFSVKG